MIYTIKIQVAGSTTWLEFYRSEEIERIRIISNSLKTNDHVTAIKIECYNLVFIGDEKVK